MCIGAAMWKKCAYRSRMVCRQGTNHDCLHYRKARTGTDVQVVYKYLLFNGRLDKYTKISSRQVMVQPIRDSSFKRVLLPNKAMKFLATNLRCEKKKSPASY